MIGYEAKQRSALRLQVMMGSGERGYEWREYCRRWGGQILGRSILGSLLTPNMVDLFSPTASALLMTFHLASKLLKQARHIFAPTNLQRATARLAAQDPVAVRHPGSTKG